MIDNPFNQKMQLSDFDRQQRRPHFQCYEIENIEKS